MSGFDFKKLKRTMILYRVVQALLIALFAYIAASFQSIFRLQGIPGQFITCIIATIVIQLLLIYPIYKLAWRDAGVEIEGCVTGLTVQQLAAIRKKRLIGDLWKFCAVAFFAAFIFLAPDVNKARGALPVLASTIFSFLISCLAYYQCFNFSAKKRMNQS